MIAFIILKLTHVIGISWWWILASPLISFVPMGLTISFILLKLLGGFSVDVSWWWILLAIAIDFAEFYCEKESISR